MKHSARWERSMRSKSLPFDAKMKTNLKWSWYLPFKNQKGSSDWSPSPVWASWARQLSLYNKTPQPDLVKPVVSDWYDIFHSSGCFFFDVKIWLIIDITVCYPFVFTFSNSVHKHQKSVILEAIFKGYVTSCNWSCAVSFSINVFYTVYCLFIHVLAYPRFRGIDFG